MSALQKVLDRIDLENAKDPNMELVEGEAIQKELIYGQRMTEMLFQFIENPSEELQIAARGQHIRRWSIPRSDFPMDRKGYLKWRTQLKLMHADLLKQLMIGEGYSKASTEMVADLVTKKKLKTDPVSQMLQDVVCLVFLKYYFAGFASQQEEEKLISIVQKTWGKMTDNGHQAALKLDLGKTECTIIEKALQ